MIAAPRGEGAKRLSFVSVRRGATNTLELFDVGLATPRALPSTLRLRRRCRIVDYTPFCYRDGIKARCGNNLTVPCPTRLHRVPRRVRDLRVRRGMFCGMVKCCNAGWSGEGRGDTSTCAGAAGTCMLELHSVRRDDMFVAQMTQRGSPWHRLRRVKSSHSPCRCELVLSNSLASSFASGNSRDPMASHTPSLPHSVHCGAPPRCQFPPSRSPRRLRHNQTCNNREARSRLT